MSAFRDNLREIERVLFGVGLGEFAVGVAGAGDQRRSRMLRLRVSKPSLSSAAFSRRDEGVRDIGNDEILPDGQANFAGAVKVGDFGERSICFGVIWPTGRESRRCSSGRVCFCG